VCATKTLIFQVVMYISTGQHIVITFSKKIKENLSVSRETWEACRALGSATPTFS
jgi:hypothetical protein